MRIGELARAADTTVRAVRHYHRLGLMPEPPRTPGGYREYGLADLVRLLRIRWLARSGVPLGSVATILGGNCSDPDDLQGAADTTADLESLVESVDGQIRTLQTKRQALAEMLERHRKGEPLSPLPPPIVEAFDELVNGEPDPRTRALFERERDSWEMLALTGQAPSAHFEALRTVLDDPERRHETVSLYRRFGALAGTAPDEQVDEIAAVAEGLGSILEYFPIPADSMGSSASEIVAAIETNAGMLAEVLPDPAQQAVAVAVIGRLAARSEETR